MAKKLEIAAVFRAIDRITRPISRIQNRLQRFTRSAMRGMKRLDRVTSKLGRTIGRGLKRGFQAATVGMVALGAAVAKVVDTGATFEKTLVSAAVKFPGKIRPGTEAFLELENAARKTGATTEFSATQSAEALTFLAMAGFDAKQSVAALPGVVDLATSANLELAEASDIATDTLGAMGLATKDAAQLGINLARVNDVLAATSTSANTTVQDMFEAIKKGGPVATDAGASIETFSALVGDMANSGIKGAEAGTAVRNMFLRLQAPTGAAAGLVKKYAGDLKDADGNMVDMITVIGRLQKSTEKLGGIERAKVFEKIFGKRTIGPVNVLLKSGAEKLAEYRKQIENATGASTDMASAIRDTTMGSIDSLKSTIEGVIISLFKLQDKGIKKTIDRMTEWLRANQKMIVSGIGDFINYLIDNFDKIVSTIKKIGVAIGVIFSLIAAIKILTMALTVVNLVMAANPVVLIVMGIVAAVAIAAGLIIYHWDTIKASFIKVGKVIVSVWTAHVDTIKRVWAAISGFFKGVFDVVVTIFTDAVNYLIHNGPISWIIFAVALIKQNWEPISAFFQDVWGMVTAIFTAIIGALINHGPINWLITIVTTIKDNWSTITGFFESVWKLVVGVFTKHVTAIRTLIDPIVQVIKDNWEPIVAFFEGIWSKVVSIFKAHMNTLSKIVSPITGLLDKITGFKSKTIDVELGLKGTGLAVGEQFDFGGNAARAEVTGPNEQLTSLFEERNMTTTNKTELTIRDETNRAEVTQGKFGAGMSLEPTGTFN
jgi:TP901 family phage tail tape measure protein